MNAVNLDAQLAALAAEQRTAWSSGGTPPAREVLPGLWCLPVPVPGIPIRYTLVYALRAPDGVLLIDAGWAAEESWDALCAGLIEAGTDITDVSTIVVTHHHSDHLGLVDRVRAASGCTILIHPEDTGHEHLREAPDQYVSDVLDLMDSHGAAPDDITDERGIDVGSLAVPSSPMAPLADGQVIEHGSWRLRTVWTPGHTEGSCCFFLEGHGALFTGDHVLPRITPAVAVYPGTPTDPLTSYVQSLEALRALAPEVRVVLPAHEYTFFDLAARLTQLHEHHEERLTELVDAIDQAPGSSAWALCPHLEWSRAWDSYDAKGRRFAMAETIAHLAHLEGRGNVHSTPRPHRWFTGPTPHDQPIADNSRMATR